MKKGTNPLIITTLIVSFCVLLALGIFVWLQSFVRTTTLETSSTANFEIFCTNNVFFKIKNACAGDDYVKLTIINEKENISKFKIRFYKSKYDVILKDLEGVKRLGILTKEIKIEDANMVKKIEIIPIVKIGEGEFACVGKKDEFGELTKKLENC